MHLFEPRKSNRGNEQTWVFSQLQNKVKYKKSKGLRSMFGIEAGYIMRFHCNGRFAAMYSNEIKAGTSPSQVILTGSIGNVQLVDSNKIEFVFRNGKTLKIQYEKSADLGAWMAALKYFSEREGPDRRLVQDWTTVKWDVLSFKEMALEWQVMLLADGESLNFGEMQDKFNHDAFITDKGLNDMFTYNMESSTKNRMLLSKGGFKERSAKIQLDPNFDEENTAMLEKYKPKSIFKAEKEERGLSSMVSSLIQKKNLYFVLASNIPMVAVDEPLFKQDQKELDEEDFHVHQDIELYCIYIYDYVGKGDFSVASHAIPLESLEYAYLDFTTTGNCMLVTGNTKQQYMFSFKTSTEIRYWLEAIKRGMEISRRSEKVGMQKFIQTVRKIYGDLNAGRKNEVKKTLDDILGDNFEKIEEARRSVLDPNPTPEIINAALETMKKWVKEAMYEFSFFLDAFVNHKVFNDQLFKFVVFRFGGTFRYFFSCYWLILLDGESMHDLLDFVKFMVNYEQLLNKWKLKDTQFFHSKEDVAMVISEAAFTSSRKAVTNIILSVFAPAKLINNRFQSVFVLQAFSHFNFLASSICKYGDNFSEINHHLLHIFRKLISVVFGSILTELNSTKMDLEQSMALCQTNGMGEFSKFLKSMVGYTGLTAKDVRQGLYQDYFDRCIVKIETFGFESFLGVLNTKFNSLLDRFAKNIFTFEVAGFFNDFLQEYKDLLDSADSDQQENVMAALLDVFLRRYFKLFLTGANSVRHNNLQALTHKVDVDGEILETFFKVYLGDNMASTNKFYSELEIFLETDNRERTVIAVLNMNCLFPDIVNNSVVPILLSFKIYFSDIILHEISEHFNEYFSKRDTRMRLDKHLSALRNISHPLVQKFVKVLKQNFEESMERKYNVEVSKESFDFIRQPNAYELMLRAREEYSTRVTMSGGRANPTLETSEVFEGSEEEQGITQYLSRLGLFYVS